MKTKPGRPPHLSTVPRDFSSRKLQITEVSSSSNKERWTPVRSGDGDDQQSFCGYDLLDDLVEKILENLPVKSVFRFRTVCKSWNSVITGPNFVNKHLEASVNRGRRNFLSSSAESSLVLGWGCSESPELDREQVLYRLTIGRSKTIAQRVEMPIRLKKFLERRSSPSLLVSHCNGILCLVDPLPFLERLVFFNPALGEHRILETPSYGPNYFLFGYGFGFDSAGDQYKFVRILTNKEASKAQVYSLKTRKWREIELELDTTRSVSLSTAYLEGRCYWINQAAKSLISLDLSRDEFRSLVLPTSEEWMDKEPRIAVRGDSLVYVLSSLSYGEEEEEEGSSSSVSVSLEMWVMERDGSGWAKIFSVGPLLGLRKMVAFWKKDEVLMEGQDRRVSSYNLETNLRREVPIPRPLSPLNTCAVLYVESLVSIVSVKGTMNSISNVAGIREQRSQGAVLFTRRTKLGRFFRTLYILCLVISCYFLMLRAL